MHHIPDGQAPKVVKRERPRPQEAVATSARRTDDAVMILCGVLHTVSVALFAATYFLCVAFHIPMTLPLTVKVIGVLGYVTLAGYGLLRWSERRARTDCADHVATIAPVAERDNSNREVVT